MNVVVKAKIDNRKYSFPLKKIKVNKNSTRVEFKADKGRHPIESIKFKTSFYTKYHIVEAFLNDLIVYDRINKVLKRIEEYQDKIQEDCDPFILKLTVKNKEKMELGVKFFWPELALELLNQELLEEDIETKCLIDTTICLANPIPTIKKRKPLKRKR